MADKKSVKELHDEQMELWRDLRKENYAHWRAWGSWFSWGSPVGLGIFFVLGAFTTWILFHL